LLLLLLLLEVALHRKRRDLFCSNNSHGQVIHPKCKVADKEEPKH
jgi:hypothetical protein